MVGVDPGTLARFHRLNQMAASAAPVLVTGPSGVGKELHARALHARSPRRDGPFRPLNCGALPPGLAEAELFGCRRGAYTGADQDRDGAFVQADRGTLFLDEVGELPEEVQPKLLRVLETGEVFPLGGTRPRRVDVRIVAATNRHLWRSVDEGRFRADLLFRLEGLVLDVPPLADRPADVGAIAAYLLATLSDGRRTFTAAALDWLVGQSWPGNVRELRNRVSAALTLTRGPEIDAPDLRLGGAARPRPLTAGDGERAGSTDRAIVAALRDRAGSRKDAMQRLGMPRSTFYARLRRLRVAGVVE
jgi:DNA-binding NtrC family response regulator